jgi:hypothetical protein
MSGATSCCAVPQGDPIHEIICSQQANLATSTFRISIRTHLGLARLALFCNPMQSITHYILSDPLAIVLLLPLALFKIMPLKSLDQWAYYSTSLRALQYVIYAVIAAKVVIAFNKWITHRWINNFIDDTTWNWPKEIAVVTGGSSGIGAAIVHELAENNVKTIILDVNPPTSKLGTSVVHPLHPQCLTQNR